MKNIYKKGAILIAGLTVALLASFQFSYGQSRSLIYGTVETIDGNSYTGTIRWGKEETYWSDMFNSQKPENPNVKYLSKSDYEKMKDKDNDNKDGWKYSFNFIWDDEYHATTHVFECFFGDIASIEMTGRQSVNVTFKDGRDMELEGGSNDIGATLKVHSNDIGDISIPWGKIRSVNFKDTPAGARSPFGDMLVGTVQSDRGEYSGRIQWDHEECATNDKLDGDSRDGDVSIPFGNIASIEKDSRGSEVVLRSGTSMYLDGSNDVNSDNRGVIVNVPGIGKVKINWGDFRKVTFNWDDNMNAMEYKDFGKPSKISGQVKTTGGKTLKGNIIYDLDETWDFEMLNGSDEKTEYYLPFRNIRSITPKNYAYTQVVLKDGTKLLLGNSQDVTDKNDGVLVFTSGSGGPEYVVWDEIEEIILD